MWPFSCKQCITKDKANINLVTLSSSLRKKLDAKLQWHPLSDTPPINTNLLLANKDFTYLGIMYMEDGWDNSRRINLYNKGMVFATYTNPDSISWWLNLDEIKK